MLSIQEMQNLIEETHGKIASVTFVKRSTGEETTRRIRTGVKRDVKGVGQNYKPSDHGLVTIFDMDRQGKDGKKGGHINIPLDSIMEVKCGKLHYVKESN